MNQEKTTKISRKYSILAVAALLVANIIWGAGMPLTSIGVQYIPPTVFVAIRYLLVGLLLLPFAVRSWKPLRKRDFSLLILASFLNVVLNTFLGTLAYKFTTVNNVAILGLTYPILLMLLSSRILHEKVGEKTIIGTVIAMFGVFIIVSNGWSSRGAIGDLLEILSVIFSATATMINKPAAGKTSLAQQTFLNFFPGGVIFTIYVAISTHNWHSVLAAPTWVWGLLIAVTIASSVVGNVLYYFGLKHKAAHETGIYFYLQSVVGVIAAYFILGQKPNSVFVIGAVLVMVGVYLAQIFRGKVSRKTQIREMAVEEVRENIDE